MPISAPAAAVIRCSAHQGRTERCVPINERMPANLRALFRLDYEAQCQDLCKRWDFVSRLHAHLVDGLLLANSGCLLTLTDADMQTEETEQHAEQAEEMRLRRGRCEELIKLRTETQMAEVKLAEYMRMYAAQRAASAAASSTNMQQRWSRHDSATSSASAQMKTPAPARLAAHPYKATQRSAIGGGHRRLSAFTGDSGVASATSVGHQLHTSTPLPESAPASETSMGYSHFHSTLKAQAVAAISRPTVLKSILKNSSAGGSSTRSGGSRGSSGGSAIGQSSVPSSAGRFIVYEPDKQQQPQQQRPQRPGNPATMMAAPASHEQRSRDTP